VHKPATTFSDDRQLGPLPQIFADQFGWEESVAQVASGAISGPQKYFFWDHGVAQPYSMPYQHFDVVYCQGLHPPLAELWPRVKRWN
jgi:hypothetical protein